MVHEHKFILPVQVTSTIDLNKLIREVDLLNDHYQQYKLRKNIEDQKIIKCSKLLTLIAEENKINLKEEPQRTALKVAFEDIRDKSPQIHLSFGVDPSPDFIEKLTTWFRKEINPYLLISIGLQPNLGAGCILRTLNHSFDFSIRKTIQQSSDKFTSLLRESM